MERKFLSIREITISSLELFEVNVYLKEVWGRESETTVYEESFLAEMSVCYQITKKKTFLPPSLVGF